MSDIKPTGHTMLGKNPDNVEVKAPPLTEAERRAIYAEAVKAVQQELKDVESARLLEEYKKQVKRALIPEEELVPVLIDLAGHADRIIIDGVQFFQGVTYNVPRSKFDSMRDIASTTWRHEREIGGANANAYRRPRNVTLNPNHADASFSHLMHS